MKKLFFVLVLMGSAAFAQEGMMKGLGGKGLEAAKAKASEVMAACKEDSVKFCPEMKGAEKLKACLKDNYTKLTPGCQQAISKH